MSRLLRDFSSLLTLLTLIRGNMYKNKCKFLIKKGGLDMPSLKSSIKLLITMGLVASLFGVIACSSDEEETAEPAAANVPVVI